jgi:hypothetical protein
LTIYDGATAEGSLRLALIWWPVAFVLAVTYFVAVMRNYGGKVRSAGDAHDLDQIRGE